jgi:trk system potassium uptake protein
MNIIIVGGGKLGYYLAKSLTPDKHHLTLIDEDLDHCKKIANELGDLGITIINGDGTNAHCLEDAGIQSADLLIAVTGEDEDNLVACLLAKNYFPVARTIARVNNPKNINIFKQLGVDSVVSSTALISDIIELEIDWSYADSIISQHAADVRIKEFSIRRHSAAAGKRIADLKLPAGIIVIGLIRHRQYIVPDGSTALLAGDIIIALAREEKLQVLASVFQ